MSQSDDFLSRWSRRKQQAAREAARVNEKAAAATGDGTAEVQTARQPTISDTSAAEPVFDLSKLPSLDSIGPDSDISAFMQQGVPVSLSRAALRRAWSADPKIRDFIGLSENSWDFTKPETITGFGQLLPTDDVKKLLARVLSEDEPPVVTGEAPSRTAPQQSEKVSEESTPTQQLIASNRDSEAMDSAPTESQESLLRRTENCPATQQEKPEEPASDAGFKRRHGGALPT